MASSEFIESLVMATEPVISVTMEMSQWESLIRDAEEAAKGAQASYESASRRARRIPFRNDYVGIAEIRAKTAWSHVAELKGFLNA